MGIPEVTKKTSESDALKRKMYSLFSWEEVGSGAEDKGIHYVKKNSKDFRSNQTWYHIHTTLKASVVEQQSN